MQENILAESAAMLPDTRHRLEEAFRELQGLAVSAVQGYSLGVAGHLPSRVLLCCFRLTSVGVSGRE